MVNSATEIRQKLNRNSTGKEQRSKQKTLYNMVFEIKYKNSDKRALIKTDFIEALLPGMQYDYIT